MRAPVMSPSHQVSQMRPQSAHAAWPASDRLATPVVAPTMVDRTAASPANLNTSCARSNVLTPVPNRLTR